MAQEQLGVSKIWGDLKNKIPGIEPKTQREPEGFFVILKAQPNPISKEAYENPVQVTGVP